MESSGNGLGFSRKLRLSRFSGFRRDSGNLRNLEFWNNPRFFIEGIHQGVNGQIGDGLVGLDIYDCFVIKTGTFCQFSPTPPEAHSEGS